MCLIIETLQFYFKNLFNKLCKNKTRKISGFEKFISETLLFI